MRFFKHKHNPVQRSRPGSTSSSASSSASSLTSSSNSSSKSSSKSSSNSSSNSSPTSISPSTYSLDADSVVLYCLTCDQPLSSQCVIKGTHRDHHLKDLKSVVHDQVKKLNELSGNLTSRERKFGDLTPRIAAAERELEEMCSRTQETLQQEYHTLQTLIEQNQQQAFFILNVQKQTIKRQLHQLLEDTQNYQSKSTAMSEDIKQLSSRQEHENPASLLGEINTVKTSLHTINKFYSSVEKKLKVDDTRIKALENSVKKIVEKNKELLPRPWEFSETITLEESKEEGNLQISEDKTEMSVCPSDSLSYTSRLSWINQQASQSFSKGLHYWEVDVGGCESWQVGVLEQSRGKGIHILAVSQERSSWVLECDGGELSVLYNNEFSRVKESNVQTLGVFLDCDKGQLKFYNVNTGCILHSFIAKFKHSVCPVFSMRPQKDSMARLKICNLIDNDDSTLDTNAYETVSEEGIDEPYENSNWDLV
ncbi:tripartite motif-containing protein 75-like [Clarias gariepinus]|uniref:tripartite motif-containing protein 75-like n=1 Tax=Clarias gariepinus TaxID=13013 RepID=UPI00234D24B3|nr:tripartite motif-containing protein 75-like [Clarias gariepinus]